MRRLLRRKALYAVTAAGVVAASPASANHGSFLGVSQSSYVVNAHADVTVSMQFGDEEPSGSLEIDLPAGYDMAQSTGTSPFSDNPSDEEAVGSGVFTGRWLPLCQPSSSVGLTLTWETSLAGAPTGTVGLIQITAAGLFNTDLYVIREGASDYVLRAPNMPDDLLCASTTGGSLTLTIEGQTADGSDVIQNPATAGTCTWTVTYGSYADDYDVTVTT